MGKCVCFTTEQIVLENVGEIIGLDSEQRFIYTLEFLFSCDVFRT